MLFFKITGCHIRWNTVIENNGEDSSLKKIYTQLIYFSMKQKIWNQEKYNIIMNRKKNLELSWLLNSYKQNSQN